MKITDEKLYSEMKKELENSVDVSIASIVNEVREKYLKTYPQIESGVIDAFLSTMTIGILSTIIGMGIAVSPETTQNNLLEFANEQILSGKENMVLVMASNSNIMQMPFNRTPRNQGKGN